MSHNNKVLIGMIFYFYNNEAFHSILNYENYSCPDPFEDWRQGSPYCYLLKIGDENFETWNDAQESCLELGGSLASLKNKIERDYVAKKINESGGEEVWIGLMAPHEQGKRNTIFHSCLML